MKELFICQVKGLRENMNLNESTRKYILLGILLFILGGTFTAKILANKQDSAFAIEDTLYQQITQLYSEGDYEQASILGSDLLLKKPNSEAVNYISGLIAANKGEYIQAAILLQKKLDINPYKVEDSMFMLQFGEVLFFAERYEDAKMVLEECRKQNWIPEDYPNYQDRVTELLMQIESM